MLCIDVEYRYRNIEITSRKVSAIPYLFKSIDYTRKFDINKHTLSRQWLLQQRDVIILLLIIIGIPSCGKSCDPFSSPLIRRPLQHSSLRAVPSCKLACRSITTRNRDVIM